MGADFTLPGNPSAGEQPSASSTSLKWGSNGELSPVDLQRVLERLTDPSLVQCQLDRSDSGG
ncbi:MAG: hypothetical protein FJ056_05255 [Cyanobacteria bacterium M_surface_10_m2_179]|nr:hypothetical protein [Cyanobacteria bacterium M_surface_10_m2_179]